MKVTNKWEQTGMALLSSILSGGYKINVNKCGLFLKFSSVEKICLQHGNHPPYFLLRFAC